MYKKIKAIIMERDCNTCGEPFEVRMDWKTNKITTKCFYGGVIRLGIGMYPAYRLDENTDGSIKFVRITSRWKTLWYRFVDLKKLILHQYVDAEYWECTKCLEECEEKFKDD